MKKQYNRAFVRIGNSYRVVDEKGQYKSINKGPVRDFDQVRSHLGYIGYRSRDVKDEHRGFFDNENDQKHHYKDFLDRIKKNPALQHSKSVKVHKMIFSLRQRDYDAYLNSGRDYKDIVRECLKQYELKHGIKLDWVAAIHEKEGHPHAHVVISGVSKEKINGRYKRVYFTKDDAKDLRGTFELELDRHSVYKEKDFERGFSKDFLDIGKILEGVSRQIQREQEKVEYEREQLRMKNKNRDR